MQDNSNEPIYLKLIFFLKSYINKNMIKGQKLLSERAIANKLNISRYTVRQALNELEKMGYIYKVHGKGTFVSKKAVPTALNKVYSFTEQMKSLGKTPETDLLEFKICDSNQSVASKLKIHSGDKIIRFKFLRKADKIPMMVEQTYLPFVKFPTLVIGDIESNSLYSVMKNKFNQKVHLVSESICAKLISPNNADLLNVNHNSPCLEVKRTSYNQTQEPIEYTICIARSNPFTYNYKYTHHDNY